MQSSVPPEIKRVEFKAYTADYASVLWWERFSAFFYFVIFENILGVFQAINQIVE